MREFPRCLVDEFLVHPIPDAQVKACLAQAELGWVDFGILYFICGVVGFFIANQLRWKRDATLMSFLLGPIVPASMVLIGIHLGLKLALKYLGLFLWGAIVDFHERYVGEKDE